MIVVDTNILVYMTISSEKTILAARAFEKDSQWVAPLLWQSEFLSVLALYLRKGMLTADRASQVLREAHLLLQMEYRSDPARTLELITQSRCSSYDCEFVALARDLGVRMLTEDRQILEQFSETAISLTEFLNN